MPLSIVSSHGNEKGARNIYKLITIRKTPDDSGFIVERNGLKNIWTIGIGTMVAG